MHSDIEINVDNIWEVLTGFREEKDYIEEIMTKNISQPISIILEQNFPLDNERETLYETELNPSKKFLWFEKKWLSRSQ